MLGYVVPRYTLGHPSTKPDCLGYTRALRPKVYSGVPERQNWLFGSFSGILSYAILWGTRAAKTGCLGRTRVCTWVCQDYVPEYVPYESHRVERQGLIIGACLAQ